MDQVLPKHPGAGLRQRRQAGEQGDETEPRTLQDPSSEVQTLLQHTGGQPQPTSGQIPGRIDDMNSGIDDLEKNLVPMATQARVQELESENRIAATQEKKVADPH